MYNEDSETKRNEIMLEGRRKNCESVKYVRNRKEKEIKEDGADKDCVNKRRKKLRM